MSSQSKNTDIIILGGGLAGLSLACQLKQNMPELAITIIEKNRFPVPEAVAKVGESTVEIGSFYLKDIIGLSEHFQQKHLKKFGLRCFFGDHSRIQDLAALDELGTSLSFDIPTYQIDRGALENHLAQKVNALDIKLIDGATTQSIEIDENSKTLCYEHNGQSHSLNARWLIDAAGRQALLKNTLNLSKDNKHKSNALWFRVNRKVLVDDWSNNEQWQQRCKLTGQRWLSTNHLMGPGYWIWIIPLASGVTSFGVVMDDQALFDSGIHDQASTLEWLAQHHPQCYQAIEGAEFMDFALVKDYSYDCKQVFSHQGWALTGEAGVFTDPFYSPGSDFIAMANTFICELIKEEQAGKDITIATSVYNKIYKSFYAGTLSLYIDQYGGFADRKMMGLKLVWDYAYYWGVLSWLFFKGMLADITIMRSINQDLMKAQKLHEKIQSAFVERAKLRQTLPAKQLFLDQYTIPCLAYFNEVLDTYQQRDPAEQLIVNIDMLTQLADPILSILDDKTENDEITAQEANLLGNYRHIVTGFNQVEVNTPANINPMKTTA